MMNQEQLNHFCEMYGWESVPGGFTKTMYEDHVIEVRKFWDDGSWGWRCHQPNRFPPHPTHGYRHFLSKTTPYEYHYKAMLGAQAFMAREERRGGLNWDWNPDGDEYATTAPTAVEA